MKIWSRYGVYTIKIHNSQFELAHLVEEKVPWGELAQPSSPGKAAIKQK